MSSSGDSACSLKYMFASLPRTERGMPIVLGGDPKGKNYLYTNNNSVYIRGLTNITECDIYTQHSCKVNCAKYAPSGFYIASGDTAGKIRIWDTVNKEHILKNEFQPLGKAIKDIAWSGDNQRIVVGGDGREKYAHVFLADSGTSTGEVQGHSKQVNSVDFKQTRPFRIIAASEDQTASHHNGPPFKLNKMLADHSNFVQCCRFSPDGSVFVTAGSDGKMFIYDAASGEPKVADGSSHELGSPAHKGGIYAICFHKDSRMLMSASGDKTVKVWDLTTRQVLREWTVGKTIEDMQLGCLWIDDTLMSVSLSGYINYWNLSEASDPTRIVKGHNKPIMSVALSADRTHLYTGGAYVPMNGCTNKAIYKWNISTGICDSVKTTACEGHKSQVQSLAVVDDTLISCGVDDTLFFSQNDEYQVCVKLSSTPKQLAAVGELVVVACIHDIAVVNNRKVVSTLKAPFEALCVDIHPGLDKVAVGGDKDQSVHIYSLSSGVLSEEKTMKHPGPITDVCFSPDGAHLAVGDGNRRLTVYSTTNNYEKEFDIVKHSAKIMCVAWSPNSEYIATGGLDTHIFIYKASDKGKNVEIRNAHPQSPVNSVVWVDDRTIVSAGQDATIKFWSVDKLPN